jgi:hypothetical protein
MLGNDMIFDKSNKKNDETNDRVTTTRGKAINKYQKEMGHILLELKAQRGHHFRQFIDQYYCYKNEHVNQNGNPDWEQIVFRGYVSDQAWAKGLTRKDVVKEHVIPMNIIRNVLMNLKNPTITAIKEVIEELTLFATVTKAEDKLLRECGLSQNMPTKPFVYTHGMSTQALFARYHRTNPTIKVKWRNLS